MGMGMGHGMGGKKEGPAGGTLAVVIAAPDEDGKPGTPRAFLASPAQGINFHRATWHGVLTPLSEPGLFAVVDRIGDTQNLEEYWLKPQYMVAG